MKIGWKCIRIDFGGFIDAGWDCSNALVAIVRACKGA